MKLPVAMTGHQALVDGRVITHPTAAGRGVGRYTIGFVRSMVAAGLNPIVLHTADDQRLLWELAVPNVHTAPMDRSVIAAAAAIPSWFVCTQLMLHPIPLDVIPRSVTQAGLPVAAIIHDVIPQRYPEQYLTDPNAAIQTRLRTLTSRSVDIFCANSTFTAETSSVELGVSIARFHVVGAAVEPQFSQGPHDPEVLRRFGAQCPNGPVVAVTGADNRKNTEHLIAAWSQVPLAVRQGHLLVIACGAPAKVIERWEACAVLNGVRDQVRFTGSVSDEEMVGLLRSATLSVLPSIEEGFGLPIAESVACGTPALCSGTSSMPEVSGSADSHFNPFDTADMANKIAEVLTDHGLRNKILAEQTRTARRWTTSELGSAIAEALRQPINLRSCHLPTRIAVIAPHPESDSGIGPYTNKVLEHWPDQSELILLDETAVTRLTSRIGSTETPVAGAAAFGRYLYNHDVDHTIAVLGSSPHHVIALDRAQAGRQHLWIHEPTVVGAVLGPAHFGGTPHWLKGRMAALSHVYSEETIFQTDGKLPSPEAFHEQHETLLRPVLGRARSLIVSSHEAAEVLTEVLHPDPTPPILVLPLGHPPVRKRGATHLNEPPRIISLGWVDKGKATHLILKAMALIDDVVCDIVGAVDDAESADLLADAAALGITDRLRLHGRVSDSRRDELIAAADVAVQLRFGHHGQMSAAITELLAAGVPVITNMTTHHNGGDGLIRIGNGLDIGTLLADRLRVLIRDPKQLAMHSAAAQRAASKWTFDDVASSLHNWLTLQQTCAMGSITSATDVLANSQNDAVGDVSHLPA